MCLHEGGHVGSRQATPTASATCLMAPFMPMPSSAGTRNASSGYQAFPGFQPRSFFLLERDYSSRAVLRSQIPVSLAPTIAAETRSAFDLQPIRAS